MVFEIDAKKKVLHAAWKRKWEFIESQQYTLSWCFGCWPLANSQKRIGLPGSYSMHGFLVAFCIVSVHKYSSWIVAVVAVNVLAFFFIIVFFFHFIIFFLSTLYITFFMMSFVFGLCRWTASTSTALGMCVCQSWS